MSLINWPFPWRKEEGRERAEGFDHKVAGSLKLDIAISRYIRRILDMCSGRVEEE